VESVEASTLAAVGTGGGFRIVESRAAGAPAVAVSVDVATCDDCLAELHDPGDRRHGYPFINCTNCGPRYTIIESVPYDRSRTTMAPFAMCAACRAEYDDPSDRRFHAEPVCCPDCGPALRLVAGGATAADGASTDRVLADVVRRLRAGEVVAVKGIGGYHLVADARQQLAVSALRTRKHREERPFALMVSDAAAARVLCELSELEEQLLLSRARPIVLLARRVGTGIADAVAPGSPTLGVMLPYTPLHALLSEGFDGPLVVTSGNASDEPIAYRDDDAVLRLAGIADAVVVHDRVIRTRVDDSVSKVVAGRVVPIRRSRGYVPLPIALRSGGASVLACGAALKSTFCLTRGSSAFVSHHIGDLADYATLTSYVEGIAHLRALLDVDPRTVAHDLHPDYPSTGYARDLDGVDLIGVQHHHAHIASCLADNGLAGPVIGVAFDGLGLGTDGTAWGGEFLVADLTGFVRVAHLSQVRMPGGDVATRQPWRMAAAHLDAAYGGEWPAGLAVAARQGDRWEQVLSVGRAGLNAPLTSSAGRLFDAVSALLGLRDSVTYEGQAAIELEHVADAGETGSYQMAFADGVVDAGGVVRALVDDLVRGVAVPTLAARFHNSLAASALEVCRVLRDEHGLSTVALSGGVFQNGLLLTRCLELLQADGFTVLTHRQVPCNDGGISLGQAAVAAALHAAP